MANLWRRFESWSLTLPLLCLAHFPNWLFAPRPYLARYLSWAVAAFWMTPLSLLSHLIPLSCLGAWLFRRSLPERLVRRLILFATLTVLPLSAALVHFYWANRMCSAE